MTQSQQQIYRPMITINNNEVITMPLTKHKQSTHHQATHAYSSNHASMQRNKRNHVSNSERTTAFNNLIKEIKDSIIRSFKY